MTARPRRFTADGSLSFGSAVHASSLVIGVSMYAQCAAEVNSPSARSVQKPGLVKIGGC
jgi:ABC-type uncharacterized transport system permease subunit